ncbi:hypothetical protein HK101_007808 [Irineochytrium annulatum]|nr:hypothetical protein HK101_007808 [Irineochytrium annulatum]
MIASHISSNVAKAITASQPTTVEGQDIHHFKHAHESVLLSPSQSTSTANTDPAGNSTSQHSRLIAIALDASPASDHAFSWAASKLISATDTVILLHVRPPVDGPTVLLSDLYAPTATDPPSAIDDAYRAESHDLLKEYAGRLTALMGGAENVGERVRGVAMRGKDVGAEIAGKVGELGCDMVVVGSKSKGALARAVGGSLSEYLSRRVECPVVVVPFKGNE